MLESWIVDGQFVLTGATEVAEHVHDYFPMEHGGLGCISAQDLDDIRDIWSSAEGSIENRFNGLLVNSSDKRLLISLDGMGLVAHFQWC
jgi:hypothetical protein